MEKIFRIQVERLLDKQPKPIRKAVITQINEVMSLLESDSLTIETVAVMIMYEKYKYHHRS